MAHQGDSSPIFQMNMPAWSLGPNKILIQRRAYDSGWELSDHTGMAWDLQDRIFCLSHHAGLEGSVNENTDGRFRPFFSQAGALTDMRENCLAIGVAALHRRPERKTLGFRMFHKVFCGGITQLRFHFPGVSRIFLLRGKWSNIAL
jgi:IS30 family transposase